MIEGLTEERLVARTKPVAGPGRNDAERVHPPPLGSQVTYRYNGLTARGTPRFARFMRVRRDLPPPDPK